MQEDAEMEGVSAETPGSGDPCLIGTVLLGLGLLEDFLPQRQRRPFSLALGIARTLAACASRASPGGMSSRDNSHGSG